MLCTQRAARSEQTACRSCHTWVSHPEPLPGMLSLTCPGMHALLFAGPCPGSTATCGITLTLMILLSSPHLPPTAVYQPPGLREVGGPRVDALLRTISTAVSLARAWQRSLFVRK